MSTAFASSSDPLSIMRIGEAWRNRSGIATLLITFIVMILMWGLVSWSGSLVGLVIAVVCSLIVWLLGLSAAGVQFMEQANGRPVSGMVPAILASPIVVLRMIGLGLVLLLCLIVVFLAAWLVFIICKLPLLGPIVFLFAVPVVTFGFTLAFLGLCVAASLAAPALWEGHSLSAALSQLAAVASQRPIQAFLNLMLLVFAIGVVMALMWSFLVAGFGTAIAMASSILGNDFMSVFDRMPNGLTLGSYNKFHHLLLAGLFGTAITFAIGLAFFVSMCLLGLSLTYLKVMEGVDFSAAKATLDAAFAKTREKAHRAAEDARRRAQEAQAMAMQRLEQTRAASAPGVHPPGPQSPTSPMAPELPQDAACPNCHGPIVATDLFCAVCGHKLRAA